jgi:hypothetical protein
MTTCAPARVSATTSGGTSPQLYLHYTNGGNSGSRNMQPSGSTWVGDLSIPNAGDATWWVSTDPFGQAGTRSSSHPVRVDPCPQ